VKRLVLTLAACAATVAVAAPAALGAPPVLHSVGHQARHPVATFSAPGADWISVYVASRPDRATDGSFFTENIKAVGILTGDVVQAGRWLYASRLNPGVYWVMLWASADWAACWDWEAFGGMNPACADGHSEPMQLVIRNQPPRITALGWSMRSHGRPGPSYYVTVHSRVRVCDDISGPVTLIRDERSWMGRHTFARARTNVRLNLRQPGCQIHNLSWRLGGRFFGAGNYTVRVWIRDADGATSRAVTRNWFTPH
jgi:hypothetical protein